MAQNLKGLTSFLRYHGNCVCPASWWRCNRNLAKLEVVYQSFYQTADTNHYIPVFQDQQVKQGAQTTIYCSVAEELANVSGLYYMDCKVKECSKLAKDPDLAKKQWEVSERLTGEFWKD